MPVKYKNLKELAAAFASGELNKAEYQLTAHGGETFLRYCGPLPDGMSKDSAEAYTWRWNKQWETRTLFRGKVYADVLDDCRAAGISVEGHPSSQPEHPFDTQAQHEQNVSMSKPISKEQLRENLLKQVRMYAHTWASYPDKTPQERCDGVAFSILALLDGSDIELPTFDLVARPHPDDKAYQQKRREDWVVDGQVINDDVHLHDMYYDRSA